MLFSNSTACTLLSGLLLVAIGWNCTGCTPAGPPRQAVSGTVTLDGKLASGMIVIFKPTGSDQVGAVAEVIHGKFALNTDIGPSVGKHDVTFDTIEPDLEDYEQLRAAGEQPFSKVKLHPRYRRAGVLSASVQQGAANSFEFELSSR